MSSMSWLRPTPPEWALAAGLPSPEDGEGFIEYVTRLGLGAEVLTHDLDERTAELANIRLASLLQKEMPADFRLYVQGYVAEHVPEERQHWLEHYQL